MTPESCFPVGKIVKIHGLKGDVNALLEVDHPEKLSKKESFFVEINKKLVPFFVQKCSVSGNKAIIKFEDVDSPESAKALVTAVLYLPEDEYEPDENSLLQIEGYLVVDQTLGELGKVKEIYETPGQDLLNMLYKDKEVLIPVNENIILKADHRKKKLLVNLPEGLLDLYLEE